jgi:hypothetical protein
MKGYSGSAAIRGMRHMPHVSPSCSAVESLRHSLEKILVADLPVPGNQDLIQRSNSWYGDNPVFYAPTRNTLEFTAIVSEDDQAMRKGDRGDHEIIAANDLTLALELVSNVRVM